MSTIMLSLHDDSEVTLRFPTVSLITAKEQSTGKYRKGLFKIISQLSLVSHSSMTYQNASTFYEETISLLINSIRSIFSIKINKKK